MSGRLSANTRSGILEEKFGCLLLEEISAVATVFEADDFGVDAICTLLLRREKLVRAVASSFFVQIKAVSVEAVVYKDHELDWFVEQEIPFFVGRADRKNGRFQLYHVQRAHHYLLKNDRETISSLSLMFGSAPDGQVVKSNVVPLNDEEKKGLDYPKEMIDMMGHTQVSIWLGEPILEWTVNNLGDEDFHQKAFDCLESWIAIERTNAYSRSLGYIGLVQKWKTGLPVTIQETAMSATIGDPAARKRALMQALPSLRMFAVDVVLTGSDEDLELIKALDRKTQSVGLDGILAGEQVDHLRTLGERFRKPVDGQTRPGDS
jgi:hypothetical protein